MKKQWEKKEVNDAQSFNARRTPRSGGLWFAKGDSKSDDFLIENKTTEKSNFTILGTVWKKIKKEALLSSRIPMLSVEFGEKREELIIMNKDDFIMLFNELRNK